ncbi:MAG TPA: hypothetical protein VGA52_06385 [Anaerolineales bacterium]
MSVHRSLAPAVVLGAALLLAACAGQVGPEGPAGPEGPQGPSGPAGESITTADLSCGECHNATTLISGKEAAWSTSQHGSGTSFARGTSSSCAGCHSGGAFSERISAGLHPGEVESGDPDPTRQDCRACHKIHETYTSADFALETSDPVEFYAFEGVTFDGGSGNLCANCHQPRGGRGEAVNGEVQVTSTHWGPHHGPQSSFLLGVSGSGVEGSPAAHYSAVENTCVGCHMGEGADHSFAPSVDRCQACHADAESFDINGTQTEVQAMLDELEALLIAEGLLDEEGHPAVIAVPEAQADALWNWIAIAHEDRSLGVHNPAYTRALLEYSLETMR